MLAGCPVLAARDLALADALGCVTAGPVVATEPVPPFANTAMDGYAVRAADTSGADRAPVRLEVVGTLAAGAAPGVEVGPGQAVRIMTGAPLPPGADAVVMVELTELDPGAGVEREPGAELEPGAGGPGAGGSGAGRSGGDAGAGPALDRVIVLRAARPGDHVRPVGDDIAAGQVVFPAGTVLGPAHLGVLASLGQDRVEVFPPATVGVLSTGDELVEGPGPLAPGQIRDSNRPLLLALVAESGCRAVDLGRAWDTESDIESALRRGLSSCDAVITSGGVSVGDFDFTKAVLDRLSGGTMRWLQVAIRPAKPLAFGVVGAKPVFGLPGNPVSSMVSFECFARPALRQMMGHPCLDRPTVLAVADEGLPRHPDGKLHLARVVATPGADGRYHLHSAGAQASHQLRDTALANALALVPDGDGVPPGASAQTLLLAP